MRGSGFLAVFIVAGFCLLASFTPAQAGLFCVESASGPPECVYDDANACRARAKELAGACTANKDEVIEASAMGSSPVCLVLSPTTLHCLYPDFRSCSRDALRNNAACLNISALQILRETPGGVINTQNIRP